MRIGMAGLTMIAGLVGLIFSLMMFLTPLSGVTGTPGPLLTALGSVALFVAAPAIYVLDPGGTRAGMSFLGLLAAILTALAAWFLFGWVVFGAMVIGTLTLLILIGLPPRKGRTA